jgi:Skp family chaperone for outer membrane proteins
MAKTRFIAGIVALLVCGGMFMASAELKIGYINVEEIFKDFQGTKDAQAKFDKEVAT